MFHPVEKRTNAIIRRKGIIVIAKYYTIAPGRQRQCVKEYGIVDLIVISLSIDSAENFEKTGTTVKKKASCMLSKAK